MKRCLLALWLPLAVGCAGPDTAATAGEAAGAGAVAEVPQALATADRAGSSAGDALHALLLQDLRRADARRSLQAGRVGFVEAVLAVTARDALYVEPRQPIVRGRDAIAALLESEDPAHARRATFDPRRIAVSADGLLGTTQGWNVFTTVAPDGTSTTTYGTYTTAWRREDGVWRAGAHVQHTTPVVPTQAPADYPLLDDRHPVIRLADPHTNADQVAATDAAFAAASVAEGASIAVPGFADPIPGEAIGSTIFYGLDQVTAAHAADPPPAVGVLDWASSDAVATFTGDLGYAAGYFVFRLTSTGQVLLNGTYLTVYRREPDGTWKWLLADSAQPTPPP